MVDTNPFFNAPVQMRTPDVKNMNGMFQDCKTFDSPIILETSKVIGMNSLLSGASSFNQNLFSFDTSQVNDMTGFFNGAEKFNQPLDNFDYECEINVKHVSEHRFVQSTSVFSTLEMLCTWAICLTMLLNSTSLLSLILRTSQRWQECFR